MSRIVYTTRKSRNIWRHAVIVVLGHNKVYQKSISKKYSGLDNYFEVRSAQIVLCSFGSSFYSTRKIVDNQRSRNNKIQWALSSTCGKRYKYVSCYVYLLDWWLLLGQYQMSIRKYFNLE